MAIRKKKILLVEDDPTQSMMYEVSLRGAGYKMILASKGKEGIEIAKTQKPDLIYLDMILGDMGGSEVIKALKADPETKDIRIVVLSNLNKKEIMEETKRLGALDFLIKMMYVPKDIVEKTAEYLKG